jgi:hypothetical protein
VLIRGRYPSVVALERAGFQPGVRLEAKGSGSANWVPAQRRLISIKGGTFQAVQVYARGVGDRDLRTAAIEIAREFEKLP